MKFFSRMLSSAGSRSSPTSSIKRGRPRDKLSSKWFLKYLWFSEVIWDQNEGHLLINGYKNGWLCAINMFASSSLPCLSTLIFYLFFDYNLMREKFSIKRQNILILLNYPIKKWSQLQMFLTLMNKCMRAGRKKHWSQMTIFWLFPHSFYGVKETSQTSFFFFGWPFFDNHRNKCSWFDEFTGGKGLKPQFWEIHFQGT